VIQERFPKRSWCWFLETWNCFCFTESEAER